MSRPWWRWSWPALGAVLAAGSVLFVPGCSLVRLLGPLAKPPAAAPTTPPPPTPAPPVPPEPPATGGSINDLDGNQIITTLPRADINATTTLLPFAKLLKYTLEIPRITIEGRPLSATERRQRYEEIIAYTSGKSTNTLLDSGVDPRSYYGHAAGLFLKEEQIFQQLVPIYASYPERIFWNDQAAWRTLIFNKIGAEDAHVTLFIALPYYIQTENMKQIGAFCFHYAWYQIRLLEAADQTGSAKAFFSATREQPESAWSAAAAALKAAQQYLNPLTGQLMAGRDPAAGLFFEDQGLGINDNAQGYRYLIEAVNSELAPLVYALGASDYGDLAPSKKLANYRGVADAFAAVAQQRVKYVEDFSAADLQAFWAQWFKQYTTQNGWHFDSP